MNKLRMVSVFKISVMLIISSLLLISCGMAFNPINQEGMISMSNEKALGISSGETTRNGGGDEIILQAWHWGSANKTDFGNAEIDGSWYNFITGEMSKIRSAGFTVLYLPPPWRDDSHWTDEAGGEGGGEGYYWHKQDLDSRYGTKADLQTLINAAGSDIKVIFDMVPNHTDQFNEDGVWFKDSATNLASMKQIIHPSIGGGDVNAYPFKHFLDVVCSHGVNGHTQWGKLSSKGSADCHHSGQIVYDPLGQTVKYFEEGGTTAYGSDFNLYHPSDSARNNNGEGYLAIRYGMQELVNMGADGWRWDYVHGYPSTHVDAWINDVGDQDISIGEYANQDYNTLLRWATGDENGTNADNSAATGGANSAVFDFLLKNAISSNPTTPKNWGGLATDVYGHNRERAVTFVKNHDTDESPGSSIIDTRADHLGIGGLETSSSSVHLAYAYILLMPGTPCVYFPDYYGDYNETAPNWADLIAARKGAGVEADSHFEQLEVNGDKKACWYVWDNATGSGDATLAFSLNDDWDYGGASGSDPEENGWTWNGDAADWQNGIRVWYKSAPVTTTTVAGTTTTTTLDGDPSSIRTVIFMQKETSTGQDMYMKGGHDGDLKAAGYYTSMSEPITYNNMLDGTTLSLKQADDYLDWSPNWSALNWTTGNNSGYHANNNLTYELVGSGYDPELRNSAGKTDDHWWKFDVNMAGSSGDWYEFKGFLNGGQGWESDIDQSNTPYTSRNHWGKKGYITVCEFNQNWVEYIQL